LSSALYYDGAPLPGSDLGTGFTQMWWSRIGTGVTAKTVFIIDSDRDLTLTSADYVVEFAAGTIADVQLSDFSNLPFRRIVGTPMENVFIDTDDANIYYGVDGDDTIEGRGGNDELYGGNGNDDIDGGQGNDIIGGGAGNDTMRGFVGTDTINGESGNDIIFGGDDGDSINGGADNDTLHGEFGNDTIYGEGGNDSIFGGADNDQIYAGSGTDVVEGGDGNDTVYGEGEADILRGGAGADGLYGGEGNDVLQGGDGTDTLDGGNGFDIASYADSNVAVTINLGAVSNVYALGGNVGTDTLVSIEGIIGSGLNDVLTGTNTDNVFEGGAGNDVIDGLGGLDTLSYASAAAAVTVSLAVTTAQNTVGAGTDTISNFEYLTGSAFNDTLTGSTVNNLIDGGLGNDTILAGDGEDQLRGGGGVDNLQGQGGDDQLFGDLGNDTLSGGLGLDILYGGEGNDVLNGNEGNDSLYGDAGTDTLDGGAGDDYLLGGEGSDTASYLSAAAAVTVSLALTTAQNTVGAGSDTLGGIENLTGSAFNDTLTGDTGSNVMDGGAGADTLTGGAGNDTYIVDNVGDNVVETPGNGTDTILSSVSYTLAGRSIEQFTLTGGANVNATGNSSDNKITGNSGNNIMDGGTGADILTGGAGNDTYIVDNVGDNVVETPGNGTDTILSSVSYTLAGRSIEQFTLTGSANVNATGNSSDNKITGNSGNNIMDGGTGADILTGGAGNDTYIVDNVGDNVVETPGNGTDTILSSVSYTLAGRSIEQFTLTGSANVNATGNSSGNSMAGNSGNNIMDGLTGSDTLTGGGGLDQFRFSTALGATNVDTITDFSVVNDTIGLATSIFTTAGAAGVLSASAFVTGAAAADASDRIIYNSVTGALLYDSDGTGAGAAIAFAQIGTGLALTNADFLLVA